MGNKESKKKQEPPKVRVLQGNWSQQEDVRTQKTSPSPLG
jgi:hypothetical protein